MSRRIVIFNSISGRGGQIPDVVSEGNVRAVALVSGVAKKLDGDYWNMTVFNNGAATIYLGFDDTVTDADGFPVVQNAGYAFYLDEGTHLYGYATAEAEARILEFS